ncbi:MAG TPA: VOC family protein [Verrucomicrobiae bacterium]|nr:VOC family protein [Verrucomicrobiae bacterium]
MIPQETRLGTVTLLVQDLALLTRFYTEVLRFSTLSQTGGRVILGHTGKPLLILIKGPGLPFADPHEAGLYHIAFLYSSGGLLARTLQSVLAKAPGLFQGASDHLVSQAFYLTDPEGNGVELYLDRPRSEWKISGGHIEMGSLPINLDSFLSVNGYLPDTGHITVGHIHLRIGNIEEARSFYGEVLGFDEVMTMPSALFISAGGYHHHIGLNTWESAGAGKRIPSLGLEHFQIIVPTIPDIHGIKSHLAAKDVPYSEDTNLTFIDPWGITIEVAAEEASL